MSKRKSSSKVGLSEKGVSPSALSAPAKSHPAAVVAQPVAVAQPVTTEKRARPIVRPFRTTKFMNERSSLLRVLLRDARLQRCIQLVS